MHVKRIQIPLAGPSCRNSSYFTKPDGSAIHMTIENNVSFLDVDATPVPPAMHSTPTVEHDPTANESAKPTTDATSVLTPDVAKNPQNEACSRADSSITLATDVKGTEGKGSLCGGSPALPVAQVDGGEVPEDAQPEEIHGEGEVDEARFAPDPRRDLVAEATSLRHLLLHD